MAQEDVPPRPPEPMETDGPDQTEASSVIPARTVQVETGVVYTVEKTAGLRTFALAYPSTLIRIGLLPNLEARLIGEYVEEHHSPDSAADLKSTRGLGPVAIGTKIYICEEKGLRPETAFLGHLTLSSGSHHYRPNFTSSQFRFSFGHTLSEKLSLGYNFGYEWNGVTPEGAGIYTLVLGYAFTGKWSVYTELFGEKPENDHFAHSAAGGIKYLLAHNWQLDISGAHALNENAPDYYLAFGLRFRLPY